MKKHPSLILIAYSEAFIATVPYLTLMALAVLVSSVFDSTTVANISYTLTVFFPFILLISITTQLAKRNNMPPFIPVALSLSIFLSAQSALGGLPKASAFLTTEASCWVLLIPLLVIKLLLRMTAENQRYIDIGKELNLSSQYIYSATLVFVVVTAFLIALTTVVGWVLPDTAAVTFIADDFLLFIRLVIDHLLWFFGLHGSNIFDTIFGTDFLFRQIFDTLEYKQFYDLFVIFGGSGAGLPLLIAMYLFGKDPKTRKVARLATPFVIFNINEILIFGLPIIFNRKLFVPFLLVPCINLLLSYGFLSLYPIDIVSQDVSWVTPFLVNAYLATGGDWVVLALQLFLLSVGVFLYAPFIKAFSAAQSFTEQSQSLCNQLDVRLYLEGARELRSYKALGKIIQSNYKIEKIINLISNESLLMYYQPKVDVIDNQCVDFEALLRIKMPDGSVRGPFFLDELEIAGLATIIDLWVCQRVTDDLAEWKQRGLNYRVSVNLHPDTLADDEALSHIMQIFTEESVDFDIEDIDIEIIERGLLESKEAIKNIHRLKDNGFSITFDDFGTGFSSFEMLCSLPINGLKIDKSLIDLIQTPKGFSICKHIAELCEETGLTCIAEGVETEQQLNILSKLDIRYIQGYYFSPAIPADSVESFQPVAKSV